MNGCHYETVIMKKIGNDCSSICRRFFKSSRSNQTNSRLRKLNLTKSSLQEDVKNDADYSEHNVNKTSLTNETKSNLTKPSLHKEVTNETMSNLTKPSLRKEVTNATMSNLTKPSLSKEVTKETMSNLTKPSLRKEVTNETMSNLTKPSLGEEVTNETMSNLTKPSLHENVKNDRKKNNLPREMKIYGLTKRVTNDELQKLISTYGKVNIFKLNERGNI